MRILYLEDRKDNAAEMESCLKSLCYRLSIFRSVDSAAEALEQGAFDVVISGVHLESENALELVRLIRCHPKLDHLPIVLIDSHQTRFAKAVNDSLELACQTLGVTHYLAMEDFDQNQVCNLVKQTLQEIKPGFPPLHAVRTRKGAANFGNKNPYKGSPR